MPVVPINGRSIVTPLWYVAIKLRAIGRKFTDISDDVEDIWLLGTHLHFAFWYVGYLLNGSADYMVDAETLIAQIKIWIDGLVEGTAFRDLLFWVSASFRTIVNDPMRFVRYRFSQISGQMYQLVYDPIYWFIDRLTNLFPGLIDIDISPLFWLRNKMSLVFHQAISFLDSPRITLQRWIPNLFTWAYRFNRDTRQAIRDYLVELYPWLNMFFISPSGEIVRFLLQRYPLISSLLNNPDLWFKIALAKVFRVAIWRIDNPVVMLFMIISNRLQENRAEIEDRIKQIVINVIMWFI